MLLLILHITHCAGTALAALAVHYLKMRRLKRRYMQSPHVFGLAACTKAHRTVPCRTLLLLLAAAVDNLSSCQADPPRVLQVRHCDAMGFGLGWVMGKGLHPYAAAPCGVFQYVIYLQCHGADVYNNCLHTNA